MSNSYKSIIRHYESCLALHGDTHRGVDWPNAYDAGIRYRVMLDVVRSNGGPKTLLDFGCGASHLYQYILDNDVQGLCYAGLDASRAFIDLSERKYPENNYICLDVMIEPNKLEMYDYVVMNGVFTEKCELSFDAMYDYFVKVLTIVFTKVRVGMAFNVMSKQVDYERNDLFHVPIEKLTNFLVKYLSRHYIVRNDYGLYEYTVYVYKEPQ